MWLFKGSLVLRRFRFFRVALLSVSLFCVSEAWSLGGFLGDFIGDVGKSLGNALSPIEELAKDGVDVLEDAVSDVKDFAEDSGAFTQDLVESSLGISESLILFNYEVLGDTFECSTDLFTDGCVEDVIKKIIYGSCAQIGIAIGEISNLEARRIEDPISERLYEEIEIIFDGILSTPGFAEYVRNNVRHYQSDKVSFPFGHVGKTILNDIYYESDTPSESLIIHELVHVWQFYSQISKSRFAHSEQVCQEFIENPSSATDYDFTLKVDKRFKTYPIEHQAEIVANYYNLKIDRKVLPTFSNDHSFSGRYAQLNALKRVMWSVDNSRVFVADYISGRRDFFQSFNGLSGLLNVGEYEWDFKKGGTASVGTGPSRDAGGNGYYLYFETSSGYANKRGNKAIASFRSSNAALGNYGFNFKYHMYGKDTGSLALQTSTPGGWVTIWSKKGQQQTSSGSLWRAATATGSSNIFRFVATAEGGYQGDIAIDNIEVVRLPSAPVGSSTSADKPPSSDGSGYLDLAHNPPGKPNATINKKCKWQFKFNQYGTVQHDLLCNGLKYATLNEFLRDVGSSPGTPSCEVVNVRAGISGGGRYGSAGGVCEFWIRGKI